MNDIMVLTRIEKMIYIIRGQRVMLDNDLAELYGVETKVLNARKFLPFAFTENGVAMLSSVLGSKQAIQVNISIMRIFTKLRSFLLLEKELRDKMDQLQKDTNKVFKIVFERLDEYEEMVTPHLPPNRKKIGIKDSD